MKVDAILNVVFKEGEGELHKQFKATCAVNRVTMTDKAVQLIAAYVEAEKNKLQPLQPNTETKV